MTLCKLHTYDLMSTLLTCSNHRTIGKWMIYIWFGLDGSGIHRSVCLILPIFRFTFLTNSSRLISTGFLDPP